MIMVEFELEDWFEEMVVTGGTRPELMLQLMDLTEEPADDSPKTFLPVPSGN